MMTPRGVADVNVYTPERVELRYGVRPDQVPDFIGLKGDTSDNIPGVPGIGDKTAGQLIAQYGSLEEVIEHADELSPARRKNILEHADQARVSKVLATMRRDLEHRLRSGAARARAARPLAAAGDVPALRVPQPAQPRRRARRGGAGGRAAQVVGTQVAWREGELPSARGRVGLAIADGRVRARAGRRRRRRRLGSALRRALRDARARRARLKSLPRLTMQPADDTLIAAYLIEPGRSEYALDDLAAEYGARARAGARDRGGDGRARPPRRGAAAPGAAPARAPRRARLAAPLRRDRAAADRRARLDGGRRASGSTRTAWARSPRGSPTGSRSSRRARTSSPARSSCSARRSRWRASCSRSSS